MKKYFFILVLILTSCANKEQVNQLQNDINNSIPYCTTETDCQKMMDAAEIWVAEHSEMEIKSVTRNRIETYKPRKGIRRYHTVLKKPYQDGYQIHLNTYMSGIFSSAIEQSSILREKLSFNKYVKSAI